MGWFDYVVMVAMPTGVLNAVGDTVDKSYTLRIGRVIAAGKELTDGWPRDQVSYTCADANRAADGLAQAVLNGKRLLDSTASALVHTPGAAEQRSRLVRASSEISDYVAAVNSIIIQGCEAGETQLRSTQLRAYTIIVISKLVAGMEVARDVMAERAGNPLGSAMASVLEAIYEGIAVIYRAEIAAANFIPGLGFPDWMKYATLGLTGWWIHGKVKGKR